jgi:hypothetical protein
MGKANNDSKKAPYKSFNLIYIVLLVIWSLLFALFIILDLLAFILPLLGTFCFGGLLGILLLFSSPFIGITVAIIIFLQLRKAPRKIQIVIFILGLFFITLYFKSDSITQFLFAKIHLAENCALFG